LRIVPVVAHAVAVFRDEHKASHWLSTPLPIFGGRAPSELLASEDGIRLVEQTLTRIEHNVFSMCLAWKESSGTAGKTV
jgi:putative toxin-antitoxin system antitoxin component (TIGR02293 family)